MILPSWLRSFWRGIGVEIIVVAVLFIVGGLSWLAWCYWWDWACREWLVMGSNCRESGSTTLRNLGLVVGGLLAIGFGIWRGVVADRQAKASQDQAKTSQRGLLNERYQKGAEMLGSEVLAVRLGGIYALQRLAEDEPEEYHVQIMRLLSSFVRNPTEEVNGLSKRLVTASQPIIRTVREDVQAALTAIRSYSNYSGLGIALEKKKHFRLNLAGANMNGATLMGANLIDAELDNTDLTKANLSVTNLTNAVLFKTNLTEADLSYTNLTKTELAMANLTSAILCKSKGLTQEQLDQACADPDNPPKLEGLCDAETGLPLEWRGKPCR